MTHYEDPVLKDKIQDTTERKTLGLKGTKKGHICIYCTLNNTGY